MAAARAGKRRGGQEVSTSSGSDEEEDRKEEAELARRERGAEIEILDDMVEFSTTKKQLATRDMRGRKG